MARIVVWFTGQSNAAVSDAEIEFSRAVGDLFFGTNVIVKAFAPPVLNGVERWAEYDGGRSETCETVGWLPDVLEETAGQLYQEFEQLSPEDHVLFAGTSNGSIPAYEFAKHYASVSHGPTVSACLLHNGCPSMSDRDVERGWRLPTEFPTLMTLGTEDYLWNQHRVLYTVAWRIVASVLPFFGRHCDLPSAEATAQALHAAVLSKKAGQPPQQKPRRRSARRSRSRRSRSARRSEPRSPFSAAF